MPIIKPSTIEFFREARRTRGYSLWDWLHGYVYGRWIYPYISIATGKHPLSKRAMLVWNWLERTLGKSKTAAAPQTLSATKSVSPMQQQIADSYHGKVVPLAAARQLVMVHEDVRLPDLESIVPYQSARDIILKNPDHIVALDCPCRSARENPCQPVDVCLVVGEPFASFVVEHQPAKSRWITPQQAVDILQAEDERGHVHHAFFKDAMLGRFYAICNCCACCCGAMNAQRGGTPMLAASGYRAAVDESLCLACGECETTCQFEALSLGSLYMEVSAEACMGCGVCVNHCPNEALSLQRDASKGEPLEIFALMEKAAV